MQFRLRYRRWGLICLALAFTAVPACGKDITIDGRTYSIPEGWNWQRVAGPPLIERPICADFDEAGNLYVAESNGSNDKVEQQLATRPHRILRLVDQNGDGVFDAKTVFADKLMFPEGSLWHAGSLYVSAPPTIWKLTDTDRDGIADQRDEWFTATLTGCANDLHGPYLGRDGWIYWCKGAFAEQTHTRPDGSSLNTRAAHIFRRKVSGGGIEAVMTGGMDNPVEVVFTPGGDRIFSTTFLQHPANGKRDGLIHAIYGGVYGKIHGVIDEHPRTGDVLPPLVHLGAAAPCGLALLESDHGGADFPGSVVVTQFNRQRVTRHRLIPQGPTLQTHDQDLIVTNDHDFHPTDVLEDADGSLLVIDTGGWYKLCCPTSNLWKPDVLGGIYRFSRVAAAPVADGRGLSVDWSKATSPELAAKLGDSRPFVTRRALAEIAQRGNASDAANGGLVQAIVAAYQRANDAGHRTRCVWALTRLEGDSARAAVRHALRDSDETVTHAALHSISLHRDSQAAAAARELLATGAPTQKRLAAEVAGRLGDATAIPTLLQELATAQDPIMRHALIYALIEINDAEMVKRELMARHGLAKAGALVALDQMRDGNLNPQTVIAELRTENADLRKAAWWILDRHEDWQPLAARNLAPHFAETQFLFPDDITAERLSRLAQWKPIDTELGMWLTQAAPASRQTKLIEAMTLPEGKTIPDSWIAGLVHAVVSEDPLISRHSLRAMRRLGHPTLPTAWNAVLTRIAHNEMFDPLMRIEAYDAITSEHGHLTPADGTWIMSQLSPQASVEARRIAVSILQRTDLDSQQQNALASTLKETTLLDLRELIPRFTSVDHSVKTTLVRSLMQNSAAQGLRPEEIKAILPTPAPGEAQVWLEQIESQQAALRERIERVAEMVATADPREGQKLYFSAQAACSTCHALGYLGGRVGPDLSKIGDIRKERDLLESILLPSQSFVRSYEPLTVVMDNGQTLNGIVKDETRDHLVLQIDAERQVQLERTAVVERHPGTVSIMPAGLAQQWTDLQLAELVHFLQTAR